MQRLLSILGACFALSLLLGAPVVHADQTLVFMRHAEKPVQGLGQISCQGLNRSLALPRVLLAKFNKPAALFASNPGLEKQDKGVSYNYVRPLATIEPTAVRLGLPVHASIAFDKVEDLNEALVTPEYRDSTVVIAWEHHLARKAVQLLLAAYGAEPQQTGAWPDDDFDSLFVLRLKWQDDKVASIKFEHLYEELNGLPLECPF